MAVEIQGAKIQFGSNTLKYGRVGINESSSQSVMVKNVGNEALVITGISFSSTIFTTTTKVPLTINAGSTQWIPVYCKPMAYGDIDEEMTITSNDLAGKSSIRLTATPYGVNELRLENASGSTDEEVTISVTMKNYDDISGLQMEIKMPKELEYVDGSFILSNRKQDHAVSATLSDDVLYVVAYSPSDKSFTGSVSEVASFKVRIVGSNNCNLKIDKAALSSTIDDKTQDVLSGKYGCTVSVKSPSLYTNNSLDFGKISINQDGVQKSITIRNRGEAPLTINNIVFANNQFKVKDILPITIESSSSKVITVVCEAKEEGDISTNMEIYTNDPNKRLFIVKITGEVFTPDYLTGVVEVKPDEVDLDISLNNYSDIYGIQFDIVASKDYTVSIDNVTLAERGKNLSVSINSIGEGKHRMVSYVKNDQYISSGEGKVMTIRLMPREPLPDGEYVITLSNIVLGSKGMKNIYAGKDVIITSVEEDPVVITAKSCTRKYGENNPTFEFTSEGATVTGVPLITCEATATSPVGSYPIFIKKGSVTNHNDTYVNGTLTITKAPLTIAAKSYIIKWGETLPLYEVEYKGFKNNETKNVLNKQPDLYCIANEASMPGTYDIIASGAEAGNYEISYTKGTLTILPPMKGDVNNDGVIDATDLSCVTSFILEDADDTMYFGSADMDDSGIVEVNDYAALVNINLGQISNGSRTGITLGGNVTVEDDTKQICNVSYTAIAGTKGYSSEGYFSLVDGRDDTKWCSSTNFANSHGGLPYYVVFRSSEKISPTWYRLLTGNDTRTYPSRNWNSWKIYGANFTDDNAALTSYNITNPVDNNSRRSSDWILIDEKTDYNLPATNFTEVEVTMSNPSSEKFQYFLIEIYKSVGNYDMQMSELSFGSQANVIPENPTQDKNALSVPSSIDIKRGERFDLPISMINEDDICSLQFDLILPTGFDIAINNDGKAITELSERTNDKCHTVLSRKLDNGAYRVIIVSATNGTFENNSDEILTIGVISSDDLPMGNYTMNLQNIVLTNPSATRYVAEKVSGILNVAEPVTITAKSYTRIYGNDNPAFEYEVSGAILEGTPEITCEATATSPVGTYPIVIKKGNVINRNDTYVNGTLTITKAPLTVKAGTYTKKQGEENPEFRLTYEGFKNGETEAVLTMIPTATTNATRESALGEYAVTVSGGEAQNYELSYVDGKLIIVDADAVVVTAKSYIREYGEANPTFEFTAEGAALDGMPEIICEATSTSPVGVYPIIIKKGGVTNYNDIYINGTLTITKAPLTIKAGTYTKKQGEPLPEFTLTYEGFKNGETETMLTKQPTVSCEATEASEPRDYEVRLSDAEAQNYEIDYVDGKLTVTEADPIILTAMSYTRQYGEENPVFEFTSEGAMLEGMPEISCEATVTSPVGTYDIVVKQGNVKNYNVTFVKGTLTITKAPLKVSVKYVEREQGIENPQFDIIYEGWKLQDNESVLTRKPVATTTATKNSPVGEYAITVSGGEAENYELKYQDGKLTVTVPSSIGNVPNGRSFDVYSVSGVLVKKNVTTLKGLPKGVYIVEGKKVVTN